MMAESLMGGPRILCIDGGGIRGLSAILILEELMLRVQTQSSLDFTPEPWQCFDLICGTGTGGITALLLGRLGKSLQDSKAIFRKFNQEVFATHQAARLTLRGARYAAEGLEKVIQAQAGDKKLFDDDLPATGHTRVAVIAFAETTRQTHLFRTYGAHSKESGCTVLQAARATSAATTFFGSIQINGVRYADGGLAQNDPAAAALAELEQSDWPWPMQDSVKEVACLVSLGAGLAAYTCPKKSLLRSLAPGANALENAVKLCVDIATHCDRKHLEIKERFYRASRPNQYFRFDVSRGLESARLNEYDRETIQHINAVTRQFVQDNMASITQCALALNPRTRGKATRVWFQGFDVDPSRLSEEQRLKIYRGITMHDRRGVWTHSIEQGFYRVTNSTEVRRPMIETLDWHPELDSHPIDLRDCAISVAVQIGKPYYPRSGAGLIFRHVTTDEPNGTVTPVEGVVFLKTSNNSFDVYMLEEASYMDFRGSFQLPTRSQSGTDSFDTVKIVGNGTRIIFYVNEKIVGEMVHRFVFGRAKTALIAIGRGDFRFDNWEIWVTQESSNSTLN